MSNTTTKIIIMAGGQEKRWGEYLGVHKHFVLIDGERLIHRTIRQLRQRIDAEINIVTFYIEYAIDGVKIISPTPLGKQNELTGGTNDSTTHWSNEGRTIILFGDVFYTDRAMDLICNFNGHGCTFFGREKKSKKTGCPWGELFGFTLLPEDHARIKIAMQQAKEAYQAGLTKRYTGWEVYRALYNIPLAEHIIKGGFLEINDMTEDFDFPLDYERWLKKYSTSKLSFWSRMNRRVFGRTA